MLAKCEFCGGLTWPWQERMGGWHRSCLKVFCLGYVKGTVEGFNEAIKQTAAIQEMPEEIVIH